MNCTEVKEMLWAYLEKEITAEEAVKIEEHLTNCAECREELEIQKEIMDSLQSLPDEELPEEYHTELMQKLQAEAAPNVVPFPVKKKKQPRWKQLSLVAAAVLVVVAAGGMDGILSMRETQNAAVQEMKAADAVMPVEDGIMLDTEKTADLEKQKESVQMQKSSKKAAGSVVSGGVSVATARDTAEEFAVYDAAAVPEMASVEAEEETMQYPMMTRSAVPEATNQATLLVSDMAAAMAEIQKTIAEAGGYEETASAENVIVAVIPVETFDAFGKALEAIGELNWTQKDIVEEGTAYHSVEIQLKTK